MIETTDLGWVLQMFDSDYDDRRGRWLDEANYRSKEKAEARAAELNAKELARLNGRRRQDHDARVRVYRESVALVAAGLRKTPERDPGEFVPQTELGRWDDRWAVEPIEIEYEDEPS